MWRLHRPAEAKCYYALISKVTAGNKFFRPSSDMVTLSAAKASDFFRTEGAPDDLQNAADLLEWADSAWRRTGGNINEFVAFNNSGIVKMKQHKWTAALEDFRNAKGYLSKVQSDSDTTLKILLNEADCYRELNETPKMTECLIQAQKIYASLPEKR
jgi:hypothetical protein